MTGQPLEARCDHCEQTRPLFLYEPDHDGHFVPVPCEWCQRESQPLLCVRCYSNERQREEAVPLLPAEKAAAEFVGGILIANQRYAALADADRGTCDGIAAATEQAEGGAS